MRILRCVTWFYTAHDGTTNNCEKTNTTENKTDQRKRRRTAVPLASANGSDRVGSDRIGSLIGAEPWGALRGQRGSYDCERSNRWGATGNPTATSDADVVVGTVAAATRSWRPMVVVASYSVDPSTRKVPGPTTGDASREEAYHCVHRRLGTASGAVLESFGHRSVHHRPTSTQWARCPNTVGTGSCCQAPAPSLPIAMCTQQPNENR